MTGLTGVLVNNAGYALWKPLETTTMAEWDRTFALTEVIQDAHHDDGIKAWGICPGFVDTGDIVKLGPRVLLRTMRNPMAT
jgi:hypothetical protein